jgi:pimeloyl-[acyl-carrier protein] methyl ester esterase
MIHSERHGGGTGLPLVCLHGWAMNLRVFDPLAARLGATRVVHALDLPGHGRSGWVPSLAGLDAQARAILPLLPPRAAVLGWSLGGQLALRLAQLAPERVTRLVLVATTARFASGADWPHGLAPAVVDGFANRLAADGQAAISDFIALQVRGARNTEATRDAIERAVAGHGAAHPGALAAGLAILGQADLREGLAGLRQPALVVSGQHDRITPAAAGEWLAAALPDARHLLLPRAGHAPFLSHADEFAAAVAPFLAEGDDRERRDAEAARVAPETLDG